MSLPFDETINLEGGGRIRLVRNDDGVPLEVHVRDHLSNTASVRLTDAEIDELEHRLDQASV